jgi:hypothetical protein
VKSSALRGALLAAPAVLWTFAFFVLPSSAIVSRCPKAIWMFVALSKAFDKRSSALGASMSSASRNISQSNRAARWRRPLLRAAARVAP